MLRALYVTNAALLVVHEIDSANWREWDLLGLGGGEAAFLLLHLPLVALVVWGYGRLVEGARAGLVVSVLLAAAGLAAGVVHAAFLAAGHPEFRTPVSLGVLAATVLVSAIQVPLAVRALQAAAARARGTLR